MPSSSCASCCDVFAQLCAKLVVTLPAKLYLQLVCARNLVKIPNIASLESATQAAQCDVICETAAGSRSMPFPGAGPDEEEEGELSALMAKLRAAKPPAEVMKVLSYNILYPNV